MRIRSNSLLRALAPVLLNGDRLRRSKSMPNNLMVHDLSRGIPFPDANVDVVYHSHVLEHLDREVARGFIKECARVLRPGGLIRVVVTDFERYSRRYLDHVGKSEQEGGQAINDRDDLFEPMLLMPVRRETHGTCQQRPLRRFVENRLLGDARKRGETHQWIYDRFNLAALLKSCCFIDPRLRTFDLSAIPYWLSLGLDVDVAGVEYKPESLYLEATRSFTEVKG